MLSRLGQCYPRLGLWRCAPTISSVSLSEQSIHTPLAAASSTLRRPATIRHFSIRSTGPSYTVFGENCMLNLRIMLPELRLTRNNFLMNDSNHKGRILLEWIPRVEGGT